MIIVSIYVVSVMIKWAWEMLDSVEQSAGPFNARVSAWWRDSSIGLIKKAITHVPLCVAWVTGAAFGAINAVTPDLGLGMVETVTPANTVLAAFMLDSVGKPIARRLKRKEQGD